MSIWSNWNSHTLLGECKTVQLLWEKIWQFLSKLNIHLPYDPAIPLWVTCPRHYMKKYIHKKLVNKIRSSFIHKNQKLKRTQVFFSGKINKLRYTHIAEYHLSNKIEPTTDISKNCSKACPVKEVNHKRVFKNTLIWNSKTSKINLCRKMNIALGNENKNWLEWAWGNFLGDDNILYLKRSFGS